MGYRQSKRRALVLVLALSSARCFPDPPQQRSDTAPGDTSAADSATGDDTRGLDTITATDSTTAIDTSEDANVEVDVVTACTTDEVCQALAEPPCVVGRCQDGTCRAVSVSVACDDGDPCTTDDRCGAGACKGRPFNEAEARNWFLAFGGDREDAAIATAAHRSGDALVVGGFHGVAAVGGTTIVADGEASDAFLLRVSPTGVVKRFKRFGGSRADIGAFVVANPGSPTIPTIIAWNSVDAAASSIEATLA